MAAGAGGCGFGHEHCSHLSEEASFLRVFSCLHRGHCQFSESGLGDEVGGGGFGDSVRGFFEGGRSTWEEGSFSFCSSGLSVDVASAKVLFSAMLAGERSF